MDASEFAGPRRAASAIVAKRVEAFPTEGGRVVAGEPGQLGQLVWSNRPTDGPMACVHTRRAWSDSACVHDP